MKHKPLLTIGIPAYNVELYIEDTVLSIAKSKNHDKLEILIINDGSSDQTLEIANRLAKEHSCIKVIDKPNGGHGSAINAALKNATGRYFRLLDGDDWFDQEGGAKQISFYLTDSEGHILVKDSQYMRDNNIPPQLYKLTRDQLVALGIIDKTW